MTPSYNKVLVDGVPVNDPGGFYDFGVTPMNSIERLELVRGPESTIYGIGRHDQRRATVDRDRHDAQAGV